MISLQASLGYVLLLATMTKVYAFDATKCDAYVFQSSENALWHCGAPLPGEPGLYCEHPQIGGADPFVLASNSRNHWCNFMVSTVRQTNERYPLTPEVAFNETAGPYAFSLQTLVNWSCYVVENGVTKESYFVNPNLGETASTVTEQCERTKNYFDESLLFADVLKAEWHTNGNNVWYPGWTGFLPANGKFFTSLALLLLYFNHPFNYDSNNHFFS